MAFAETQKLVVQLDLKGNLTQKLGAAARAVQGFDKATSNTQRSLSKLGRNLERGIVLGAAAAAGGFVAVAKAAGDFEAQMNTIATIVDRKDIPAIGEQLRKTARETGVTLDDLTSAYYDLASAGIQGSLATATLNDAVTLGIGGLATTAQTVNLLSTAINTYHLDAAGAAKATDQFALAIADGVVHADEIAATFSNVASVGKAFGVGIDQIAASFAYLTKQGVDAAEVTTQMQRAIISLVKPTGDLETAQKKLKINFAEEIKTKGLVGALQELRAYSDKTGVPLIALLGRIEAVKYVLNTTGPEFKGYTAELAKMATTSGVAAKQMEERQQGLNYQLKILKAGVHDAAITIGSELLPKLTPLVNKFNEFLNLPKTQGQIRDFATRLADGFEKFATAIQKVDWTPFIDGLKLSAEIAKDVIGAFRSLPEDLQKLVVAGFALNKVTGGLGTSIAKDIGGALLNQFAARGSSPANPLFVVDVAGGLGGVGAAAGAGAAATGLALTTAVVAPAAVAAVAYLKNSEIHDQSEALKAQTAAFAKAANDSQLANSIKGVSEQLAQMNGIGANAFGQKGTTTDVLNLLIAEQNRRASLGFDTRSEPGRTDFSADTRSEGAGIRSSEAAMFAAAKSFDTRSEAAGIRASVANARVVKAIDALHMSFNTDLAELIHATKAADIAKAAKKVAAEIAKGVGNVDTTTNVLGDLRKQLKNTHDPALQKTLREAITKVERRLPAREFAAKQFAATAGILKDGKITKNEAGKLKSIMQALKDHGLPHAAAEIQKKIDAAKKAETAAQAVTTQAIKDKDLNVSVSVPLTVNASMSLRNFSRVTIRSTKFGKYANNPS